MPHKMAHRSACEQLLLSLRKYGHLAGPSLFVMARVLFDGFLHIHKNYKH
jgi:hypothetical protein